MAAEGNASEGVVVRPRPAETAPAVAQEGATSLSIIVPTYNESDNILPLIDRTRAVLDAYPFEVIVVDDDSSDGTWQLVRTRYEDDVRVSVVRRTGERGLATAVVRGMAEAENELCVVMDADLQHPPEKLPELVDAFEAGVDLVIASRYVDGGGIERWSRFRRFASRVATRLVHLALPPTRPIADPLSGFFAVRRDVVRDVSLVPVGYKILLEVLARCRYDGVREVPYVFHERERGDSKLGAGEYVDFLQHVLRLRRRAGPTAGPA